MVRLVFDPKSKFRISLVGIVFFGFIGSIIPAGVSHADDPSYRLAHASPSSDYNSIAKWDPVLGTISLYGASSLIPQTDPSLSWLPSAPDSVIDVNANRPVPGIYDITWGDSSQNIAPLVITTNPNEVNSKVLVIVPDYTWAAYNKTGGGSMYTGAGGSRPTAISIEKPLSKMSYQNQPATNPIKLIRGIIRVPVDVALQSQIGDVNYDLGRYKTLVIYGHDEYWTSELRTNLETVVGNGSNLLNLSGNTGYWEINRTGSTITRVESSSRPMPNRLAYRTLGLFRAQYLGRPVCYSLLKSKAVSKSLLVKLHSQAFPRKIKVSESRKSVCQLFVHQKKDPLFRGARISKHGFTSKQGSGILGTEIDGLYLTTKWQVRQPAAEFLRSSNLKVLAGTWDADRVSLVGIVLRSKTNKGTVITLGSNGWVAAMLNGDKAANQIAKNALLELLK